MDAVGETDSLTTPPVDATADDGKELALLAAAVGETDSLVTPPVDAATESEAAVEETDSLVTPPVDAT